MPNIQFANITENSWKLYCQNKFVSSFVHDSLVYKLKWTNLRGSLPAIRWFSQNVALKVQIEIFMENLAVYVFFGPKCIIPVWF